jgi:hypothetical protein
LFKINLNTHDSLARSGAVTKTRMMTTRATRL